MSLLGLPLSILQDIVCDVYNHTLTPKRDTHPDALLIAKPLVQPVRRALFRHLRLRSREKAQSLVDLLAGHPNLGAHCRTVFVRAPATGASAVTAEQVNAILITVTRLDSIGLVVEPAFMRSLSLGALECLAAASPSSIELATIGDADTPEVWSFLSAFDRLESVELTGVRGLAGARRGSIRPMVAFCLRLFDMSPEDEVVLIRTCQPVLLRCQGGDMTLAKIPDWVCEGMGYLNVGIGEKVSAGQIGRFGHLYHLGLPPYSAADIVDVLPATLAVIEFGHGDIVKHLARRLADRSFLPKLKRIETHFDDETDDDNSDGGDGANNREDRRALKHDLLPICQARGIATSSW